MNLGQRIRELRRSRGISQKQLAELTGLSQSFISTIERGEKNISINSLKKICSALGMSLSEFFNRDNLHNGSNSVINKMDELFEEIMKLTLEERSILRDFLASINQRINNHD